MSDFTVEVSANSRLRFSKAVVGVDGVPYLDLWSLTDQIPVQADDSAYIVAATDTIATIATKFYGDPVLWWAIALANDIVDPLTEVYEGRELRIVSGSYIKNLIAQKSV
jgi:nucleoid-associated protein YgaU